jgi:hypothetical protein
MQASAQNKVAPWVSKQKRLQAARAALAWDHKTTMSDFDRKKAPPADRRSKVVFPGEETGQMRP